MVKTPTVNVDTNNEEEHQASLRIEECLFDLNQEFTTDWEVKVDHVILKAITLELPEVEEVVEEINEDD
ncbi:hypothetical protein V6N13_125213 [Hibiscus sabdariffa]